jgi:hypothetical protein
MSPCFRKLLPFGAVPGSLSDLLGLRLPLPLQSRPAQISDGPQGSTKQLAFCRGNTATLPSDSIRVSLLLANFQGFDILLSAFSYEEVG